MPTITILHPDGKSNSGRECLYLLYLPVAGADALLLYEILDCLDNLEPDSLKTLSGLPAARIQQGREWLERLGLLERWQDPASREEAWLVRAPLAPMVFLRHETYSRLLLAKAGPARYDRLLLHFSRQQAPRNMLNCTLPMDPALLEDMWDGTYEDEFQQKRPAAETYGFDWNKFYRDYGTALPQSFRTRTNEEAIARLAHLYGLDEEAIGPLVIKSCPRPARILKLDQLKALVLASTKTGTKKGTGYHMSPAAWLRSRQNGTQLASADLRLLERLHDTYGLADVLINHLLDYVLESTNGQLPRALVEKLAATWVRIPIDTEEKAIQWKQEARNPFAKPAKTKRQGTGLPDWYANMGDQSEPDADVLAEIEQLKQKVRQS